MDEFDGIDRYVLKSLRRSGDGLNTIAVRAKGVPSSEHGGEGAPQAPSIAGIGSSRIKRVLDYWVEQRAERRFPSWSDISLMDLYDVAPFVAVLDVENGAGDPEETRFRYRFCGTWLVEGRSAMSPADPTGRCIDEVPWPFEPMPLIAACSRVATLKMPVMLAAGMVDEYSYKRRERGFFPLGPDDGQVTQILACIDQVEQA
tara:strand:- start:217 stop:822 length:606 start_codon:yes stop_codon:yes gene_type:complete